MTDSNDLKTLNRIVRARGGLHIAENPRLLDRGLLGRHYSRDLLASRAAGRFGEAIRFISERSRADAGSSDSFQRVLRRWRVTLVAAGCASVVAACGSSSPNRASSTTPASSSPSPANGEASKSPIRILSDAATALRGAQSYEMRGTIIQGRQHVQLQLLAGPSQTLDMTATTGRQTYEVLHVFGAYYVRANASFWTAHEGARGALLAGRWIHTSSSPGLTQLGNLQPATLARCLTEDHGSISAAGTTSVDGEHAVVLRDAGNVAGSQPSTLAVAATGPPYPLRLIETGKQRAGGRIDVCNDGRGGSSTGSLTLNRFNQVPPLQAPTNAIQAQGGASS